jgi:uncharacterized protein with von Willebrand factor type A (vWA) domain
VSRHNSLESFLGVSSGILSELFSETNSLELDNFDKRLYGDLRKESSKLKDVEKAGSEQVHFPELMNDIWGVFYKSLPSLRQEEQVKPSCKVNRQFIEKMLEDSETGKARIYTVLDELSAGIAAINAGQQFLREVENRPPLKDAANLSNQAAQAEADGDQELAEQLAAQAEQKLQGAARDVRRAVKAAAEAGQEKAEETNQILGSWGLEPGDLSQVPIGERLQLVEKLVAPRLKNLSDLIGRLRNLSRARQKEKLKRDRDEIHGITMGDDLGRVLPSELGSLRHPLLKKDFYRKFSERQLLQYQLRTNEPQGRGPILALVDVSGSMEGMKLDWAIAVSMGLLDTATRQKRQAAFIFFNGAIVHQVEFLPGEKDPKKLLEVATIGASGGTNYEPPLTEAIRIINSSEYERADITMITDGQCQLSDEMMANLAAAKQAKGFRCWSVLIGSSSYGEQLKEWSDRVWPLSHFTEEDASEVFGEVFREVY